MFGFAIHPMILVSIFILDWILRISAIFIVPRNRRPNSALAWLMLIFIFPIPGVLFYLLIGNPKLPKSRRDAQKILDDFITKTLSQIKKRFDSHSLMSIQPPEKYAHIAQMNTALAHMPTTGGNKVDVITDYHDAFAEIVRDIDKAQHFVYIEYFIACLDDETSSLFEALARAVKRGVTVRFLYDAFSTRRYPGYKQMLRFLEGAEIEAVAMLPLRLPGMGYVRPDLRNHRKIVVIDGVIGYMGSQNLIRRNYHRKDTLYYDELVAKITGVASLHLAAIFMTDWHAETGQLLDVEKYGSKIYDIKSHGKTQLQVVPSGPGYDDENNLKLFVSLIHRAEKSVSIINPYFVPDESLSLAIVSAARRGIKVTMINSEAMDQWMVGHAQRSFYEQMLTAGVKIYLYKTPILLHSKFMIIDDDLAMIGSSNMDIRSFWLDLEVSLVAYDRPVARRLQKIEQTYLAHSRRIKLATWRKRPTHQVLLDNIARLTSALQ